MEIKLKLNNVETDMLQKLNLMTGGTGANAVVNALYSEFRKHFGANTIARAAALRRAQVQLAGMEPEDEEPEDEDEEPES